MKVTYHGYYGAQNSGDDAFVDVASWGAQKYWNANEHLFFSDQLPVITCRASFFSAHKSYFSFLKAVTNVFTADIFLSAGGSTFHSSLKKTDLRTYARYKKRLYGTAGAIGISLGPYTSAQAEKDTVAYLKDLSFLALRDRYSYNLACSYNLPYKPIYAFDLAALLPEIYPLSATTGSANKIIGVSVCNYEQYLKNGDLKKEKHRNEFVLAVLKKVAEYPNALLRFFIFNGNSAMGDTQLTAQIIETLKQSGVNNIEVVPYLANVKETWNKVAECNIVISTRLHASIFACFAGVPFFLLEYHRKCADFLDDIGQNEQYRLYDGDKDVQATVAEMNDILTNAGVYKQPLNVQQAITRAGCNFTETYKRT